MQGLFFVFLALHLIAALLAYGSTVLAPFLSRSDILAASPIGKLERFAAEKLAVPAALSMPFSGAGMIVVAGINPTTHFWLWASVALYLGTLAYMLFRQWPGVINLIRGSGSAAELRRLRQSSIGILVVILVIGWMMIFKPGNS